MKKYSKHWKKNRLTLLLLLSVSFWGSAFAQTIDTIDWSKPLPVDSSIRVGVLPNGLHYFIKHNNEPQDRAEFRLAVKAGSLQEEDDQLGVAHFVEHLAFNGTEHFEKNTLIDFMERNGSGFGADLNAYTSFDRTVYKLKVQTDTQTVIDTALQILVDWAGGVRFEPEEVDKERGIIRSEWRSRLNSNQRLQDQAYAALYPNTRHLNRMPIGDIDLIDTVSAQRLIDYYQRWYQPQNMAIIAVGNFSVAEMESAIQEQFSLLKNAHFTPAEKYPLDTAARRSFRLATDDEAAFTRWELTYQLEPLLAEHTLGGLRQQLLYNLYSRMLNKRFAEIREQEVPPFTFASAQFSSLLALNRSYRLSALVKPEQVLTSLRRVLLEPQRVRQHPFSEDELEREKRSIIESYKQAAKETDKRQSSTMASSLVNAFLDDQPLAGSEGWSALVAIALSQISTQDLQVLANSWSTTPISTAILSTNSSLATKMPDSSQFYQLVDSMLQLEVPDLARTPNAVTLLDLTLPALPYQLLAQDTVLDLYTYRFPNGLTVHLKTTDFANDKIFCSAFSPGGLSQVEDKDYPTASYLTNIQAQSGLDTFSERRLSDLLSDKQVSVGAYIGEYEEGISGRSNQEDLETLFQLLYLQFTRPRFDSLALANFLDRQTTVLENLNQDPRTAFGRMVTDLKYNYHPRRPYTSMEKFSAIDATRVDALYRERFGNAADFEFVFVGNFDRDSLLDLAGRYLAHLPGEGQSKESWQDRGRQLVDYPIDTLVRAGQTPKAEVILNWHGAFPYADTEAKLHFIALRALLNIRLREELRERISGVYGVRISNVYRAIPDSTHQTSIRFNAEPDMVDSLVQEIYQEVARIAAGEIQSSDLEKIKATQLKSYEEAVRTNRFWLGQIRRCMQYGLPLEGLHPGVYPEKLERLTVEGMAEAARLYLLEAVHFKFLLLPE